MFTDRMHQITKHSANILRAALTVFAFTVIIFTPLSSFAQSKEELEKQRIKLIKDIEKTSSFLKNTQKNKTTAINEFKALEQQIENRKKLIANIKEEIHRADKEIGINNKKKDSISIVKHKIEDQYLIMVRNDYIRKLSNNKYTYLLSSESMNQFLLRWRYIKQFENFVKQKEEEINTLNQFINASNERIQKAIEERKELLSTEEKNFQQMQSEIKRKNELLKKLNAEEVKLSNELAKQNKEREKLNSAIEKIILAELAARKAKEAEEGKESKLPAEIIALSKNFEQNKSKLPWPVKSGYIASKFGDQPHPTLKSLTITNNGIDIKTGSDQEVQCIFDGKVVGITNVPGYKMMVIIQHGAYYTVYSNLENVKLKKDEAVKTGQVIGKIIKDDSKEAELHFELWKDKTKLNPELWLKAK